METPTCPRHPDVETRLRCSACNELICPSCGSEAAVGYKCPDCKAAERGDDADGSSGTASNPLERLGAAFTSSSERGRAREPGSAGQGETPPMAVNVRATIVGAGAALGGGLLLGPVLMGGAFFLISAGVIGWLVARSVYWASEERSSPYLRAAALSLAGLAVAIGLAQASSMAAGGVRELAFVAFPAAIYGGWIVVRQR